MKFRIFASLLVLIVLAGLVMLTQTDTPFGFSPDPAPPRPPSGLSSDDKVMKELKIN